MSDQIATKAAPIATFTVFKTAKGMRWIAFSSNGYEDKDREIISTKALEADVQRTAADGQYGPLRWWHVGNPDPTNLDAPWGDGVDLGWCDYAAMSGPFLVESGTFISDAVGEAISRKAADLAVSLGFFHPRGEPDADGVFHHIRRFERSLAPYGRVSNPLTAFYVPGATTVNEAQMQALKALLDGNPNAQSEVEELISKYTASATKTAEAAGLRFKTQGGQPVYALPDGTPAIIVDGQIVALKAAEMPRGGEKAEDEGSAVVAAEEAEGDGDEVEMDYAGDMSVSDFKALVAEAVKAALDGVAAEMKALSTRLDVTDKLGKSLDEFKAMLTGTAQKDAGRAEEIAALQTQLKTLSGQLAELMGDQPAAVASESERTVTPVDAPDKFEVTKKSGAPAYAHPADQIGAWVEGLTS